MSNLHAIILGIVQGLAEFLPISSSGHLAIVQSLLPGFDQPGLLYDTLLHLATLMAVMIFFRQRIANMIKGVLGLVLMRYRSHFINQKTFIMGVIIATIPTGILGLLLKDRVEVMFGRIDIIGYFLILTSILLFFSDKVNNYTKRLNTSSALVVGIVQGLAVVPGLSRSGSTIFAGLKMGLSREAAAEFSFIISIPAIIGAAILQARHLTVLSVEQLSTYGLGMLAAFISGSLAISIMMFIVKKAKLIYFAVYCLIMGIIAIVWL